MKEKKLNIENNPGFPRHEAGYAVPEGYFESFGERLNLRMEAEGVKHAQKQIHWYKGAAAYLRPALGIAAGLAILVTIYLHPYGRQEKEVQLMVQDSANVGLDDQPDLLSSTYASLISDGQLILALAEMDDYDASKISKDELADYLASNCSESEILNDGK